MTYVSVEANSVDSDQTRPDLGSHCLTKEAYNTFQQMTKADNFCCDCHFDLLGLLLKGINI